MQWKRIRKQDQHTNKLALKKKKRNKIEVNYLVTHTRTPQKVKDQN